jgi:phosphatidylserine decarboxylase
MLTGYGKREWLTILAIGALLAIVCLFLKLWWLSILMVVATAALLSFYRDPERRTPTQRNVMVSPADGRISSIHQVDHFEPFGESATCVRIFLSVANVHVNRSPCHALVRSVAHKPGEHLNALNPDSAEVNESTLLVLLHPTRRHPLAAVRQVAGLLARTIVCAVQPEDILQRGQRYGMIKLGSTTELYIPTSLKPEVAVAVGQKVFGGLTVLAKIVPPSANDVDPPSDSHTKPTSAAPPAAQ